MSELYDPKFDRSKFGNYNKDKSFISLVGGTDAFFSEDEINELQCEQNENRANILRKRYNSGIYKKIDNDLIINQNILRPNLFSFKEMTALVNGYLIDVTGNLGFLENDIVLKQKGVNNVLLPEPPLTGIRYDLVYLEVWFSEIKYDNDIWAHGNFNNYNGIIDNDLFDDRINGETCRRIQLQWAIRTAAGNSLSNQSSAEKYNLILDNSDLIVAYGGYTAKSDYTFKRVDKIESFSSFTNINKNDLGLWIAGNGIAGEMNTVDGYSYAIPLFKVIRRNSSPYKEFNTNGGSLFSKTNNISDRPDGKFSNIIYEDDIIDLRNKIDIEYNELNKILDRNFTKLMTGELNGLNKPKLYGTYFGIDPIIPQSDTKLYLSFNQTIKYLNINPVLTGSYEYVPGVEQEGIKFKDNSYLDYSLNFALDRVTIQMIIKCSNLNDKDLFSIRNTDNEVLACYIMNNTLIVEDSYSAYPKMIAINMEDINGREFTHLGLSWSKTTQKMYLTINNNVLAIVNIDNILKTGQFKHFIIGKTDKNLNSEGTIFDEVEVANRFTTSFSQLPLDIVQGNSKLSIDTQKGRRNYTYVSSKSNITIHPTYQADDNGQIIFSINAPIGGTFTNDIPNVYFDNESVLVTNISWTGLNTKLLQGKITGLGPNVYYNLVIVFEVQYEKEQGFYKLPHKMHKVICEESKYTFLPVRNDRLYEEHLIDRASMDSNMGSTLDRYKVYKSNVTEKLGFCTSIKYNIKLENTDRITLNKVIYDNEITFVHSANYNILDMQITDTDITLIFNQIITGDVELILGTRLPNVTYNYIAGGIEQISQVEKVELFGDGINSEFIHRSDNKILSSAAVKLDDIKTVAFIDGKMVLIDCDITDTFIKFKFNDIPKNKSNIVIYIVTEYPVLRSERIKAVYEVIEYQGCTDIAYISEFDGKSIEAHLNSIFVTTDGINIPLETRLNKNILSTAYLPTKGEIDTNLYPTKIAGNSTCMNVTINYAEMNDNDFNNSLPMISNLKLDLVKQILGRGYTGFTTIDNKSLYSLTKLNNNIPHLNVLPLLVKDVNGIIKLVVITTYSEDNMIYISGEFNKSAIDVFDLDENILIK